MRQKERRYVIIIILIMLCGVVKTSNLIKTVNAVLVFPFGGNPSYDPEQYGSFTPESTYSYDGKLVAEQRVEKGIGIGSTERSIIVEVKNVETGKLVGSFSPARAWDFWGICWERDSYDIWVQSGDIGIYCYRYENGEWKCDLSHPERPDYIISKYDMKK